MISNTFVPYIVGYYGDDLPETPIYDDDEPGLYELALIIGDRHSGVRELFRILVPNKVWLTTNKVEVSIDQDFLWLERGFLFVRNPYYEAVAKFIRQYFQDMGPYEDWDALVEKMNINLLWEGSPNSYPPSRFPQNRTY